MIRNAVLNPPPQPSPVRAQPVPAESAPAEPDVVLALVQAFQRPGQALELAPGSPTPRPFDAQYWACWLITTVFLALLGYLWITH